MARGVGKARFQQSATTHSGTGEKETLNMKCCGNESNVRAYNTKHKIFECNENRLPENAFPTQPFERQIQHNKKYNTTTIITIITIITVVWWHGGVGKARFQQSATTHSGTGEKETLNINVVGKIKRNPPTLSERSSVLESPAAVYRT